MDDITITEFDITEPITDVNFVRVMDPSLANDLMSKLVVQSEIISHIESYQRITVAITALWRHTECLNYLEGLIVRDSATNVDMFTSNTQDEMIFLYNLLIDQHVILALPGEQLDIQRHTNNAFLFG